MLPEAQDVLAHYWECNDSSSPRFQKYSPLIGETMCPQATDEPARFNSRMGMNSFRNKGHGVIACAA